MVGAKQMQSKLLSRNKNKPTSIDDPRDLFVLLSDSNMDAYPMSYFGAMVDDDVV